MEPDKVGTWRAASKALGRQGRAPPPTTQTRQTWSPRAGWTQKAPFSLTDFYVLFITTTKASVKRKAINHNHACFTTLYFVPALLSDDNGYKNVHKIVGSVFSFNLTLQFSK